MILHVNEAKYLNDYKVEVVFNDGKRGIADLSDIFRGPVFTPLKDKKLFAQLHIDEDLSTIAWPNGADLAPEYVYYRAFKDVPELQNKFKEWGYISEN
jgi:hypothetical protein